MDVQPSPEDRRRQDGLIITTVVMTVMAGIFVLLRCISRFILIRTPGLDDYFIIGAMLMTIGYCIEIFILRANHLGFPAAMLTPENMVTFVKVTLAIQVGYYANVFFIKVSICLTYLRFAVSRTFRILCYGTIAVHTAFFTICLIVTLSQCRPLHKMWDLLGTEEGSCINTTAFFYTTSAFNIITDIWILAMPFKTLRGIQRPSREKIALFIIFGVGTFAAVASIVRLHTIYIFTLAADPFRDGVAVNLWSMIEVTIAISCASVSALKPIFSSRQRQMSRQAKSSSSTTPRSANASQYMHSQANDGPRQHVRMASVSSSVKEVMNSRTSNVGHRSSMEKGNDSDHDSPGGWAVPANLLHPPPQVRGHGDQGDDLELTFLQAEPEAQRNGSRGRRG